MQPIRLIDSPQKADVASTTETDPTPGFTGAQFFAEMSIFFYLRRNKMDVAQEQRGSETIRGL
jgi:hypothetical protein